MRWIDEVALIPQADPQRHTVMLSAGHSDADPGAVANGYTEAGIVLELRDMVSEALAGLGIRHVCDGEDGENLPLSEATAIAAAADIAVEFHLNAASPAATGVETLSRPEQFPLARQLCDAAAEVLGIRNRGAKPEGAGRHHRLAFVSDGGGIIFELFFLTNPHDLDAYLSSRNALAVEIAQVLARAARAS